MCINFTMTRLDIIKMKMGKDDNEEKENNESNDWIL